MAAPLGVAPPDPNAPHVLNLNVGVAEGYDTDVQAEFGSVTQDTPRIDSFYSELSASGEYRWQGQHVEFGASGASTVKYYQSLDEFRNVGESAGVGVSAQLAPRTSVFANGSAAYSPSYLYGLFPTVGELAPGDSIPSAPDYGATTQASYNYGGVVRLTHALGARDGVVVRRRCVAHEFRPGDRLPARLQQLRSAGRVRQEPVRSQHAERRLPVPSRPVGLRPSRRYG